MGDLYKTVFKAIDLLQNPSSIRQITKFIEKTTSDSNLFPAVEKICLEAKRSGILDECWGYYYKRSKLPKSDKTSSSDIQKTRSEKMDDSSTYEEKEKMRLFNFYVTSINNFFDINLLEWFGMENLTSSTINKKDTNVVVKDTNVERNGSGTNNIKCCYVRLKRIDHKPKPVLNDNLKIKKKRRKSIATVALYRKRKYKNKLREKVDGAGSTNVMACNNVTSADVQQENGVNTTESHFNDGCHLNNKYPIKKVLCEKTNPKDYYFCGSPYGNGLVFPSSKSGNDLLPNGKCLENTNYKRKQNLTVEENKRQCKEVTSTVNTVDIEYINTVPCSKK